MATIVKRYDPKTQRTIFGTRDPINVIDNNGLQFVYYPATNTRYPVTGPGARAAINQLYGQPITGVYLTRANRGPNVVDLYGGPNQIEMVIAGRKADPLTNKTVTDPQAFTTGHGQTIHPVEATQSGRDEIAAIVDYLPQPLIDIVLDEWEESESMPLAIQAMRQSPKYEQYFPGMKRDDGTIRYANEQEYTAVTEAFNRYWKAFGTNSNLPTQQIRRLHEGDVSPDEWNQRISQRYAEIEINAPQIRAYYQRQYGGNFSSAALLVSSVLDESPVEAQRKIMNAQIGGTASQYGFSLRLQEAERLRTFGLDQAASQRLFAQAQSDLPKLNSLLERHNDPDDTFNLNEFTEAVVVQDADQLRRISQLLASEASLFSSQRPFAADESGLLRGLRR